MIGRLEAWTIARAVAGRPVNGELETLSGPLRQMVDRILGLPEEARNAEFLRLAEARDDGPELIEAVAAANPDGSPPEGAEPGADWLPLALVGPPPAEPFPVDVLPDPVARLVTEGAAAIGCPPDFLALPALAVAAGAIGRSVSLNLKPGYFAPASIFGACVGPPSDGKTPALKAVAVAPRRIDMALAAEHEQAMERWRDEAERPGPDGKRPKPPPAPKPRRIDVDDITMEALPPILAQNPRGLVMVRDELTALVLGLNQYKGGKGNDRSILLKLWSGDSITKDRVTHENFVPIRCPHPCLSIVGGLPPDMLGEMGDAKGRADGLLDRFLFCYPDPMPVPEWSERGIPEDVTADWCALVARLWERSMAAKDGKDVPNVVFFTPEGKAIWEAEYDAHATEMNASEFPPTLRGAWGKLREQAGRLALILTLLDHAADPTADPFAVPSAGPRIVANAWRLVAYFKAHTRRVHAAISQGRGIGGGRVVQAIVEWLRSGQRLSFSERELTQARRWIEAADLAEALKYLADRNAIRRRPDPEPDPKGGRPPLPVYDVNPALLKSQNPKNPRNPGSLG